MGGPLSRALESIRAHKVAARRGARRQLDFSRKLLPHSYILSLRSHDPIAAIFVFPRTAHRTLYTSIHTRTGRKRVITRFR